MKCQQCNQNEVNFSYSSSINGAVTETHLCSECAQNAGYDINSMFKSPMFGFGSILEGLMPPTNSRVPSSALMSRLFSREGKGIDQFGTLSAAMPVAEKSHCDCGSADVSNCNTIVDEDMTMRRKLNMEMRAAVESEDFEKAAELRDKIRGLDA